MTDDNTAPDRRPRATLDAEQVSEWLSRHPDFFEGRETLLMSLQVPHPQNGHAISLVERLIHDLRQRTERAESQLEVLLDTARQTEQQYRGIRALVLALLITDSNDALAQTLSTELSEQFGIHHTLLWRQMSDSERAQPPTCALDDDTDQWMAGLLAGQRSRCLSLDALSAARILPDSTTPCTSCALTRLALGDRHGYLVLAHANPEHFASHMDTLFVDYLGEVVARLLMRDSR